MRIYFFPIFMAAFFCVAWNAEAGISVRPTVIEQAVIPGEILTGTYTVQNTGDQSLIIDVEPEDWFNRMHGNQDLSVEDWFKVSESEFELAPGAVKKIEYTITAPMDLELEKAAQVFFAFREQAGIRSRLGVVVYITKKDAWELNADIKDLIVKNREGSSGEPMIVASFKIKNHSNVHIRPKGMIRVLKDNKEVAAFTFIKSPAIYPDQDFAFTIPQEGNPIQPGRYQVEVNISYGHTYDVDAVLKRTFEVKIQ